MITLGLDIGSNSVGSAWIDLESGHVTTGTSVFPAGVDESDDKRGEPRNAKRRMARRTRITLARRAHRKTELRLRLREAGLLPREEGAFRALLQRTDPWALRRRGLDEPLGPFEFGRVLLHLAQRRGALGLKALPDVDEEGGAVESDDGRVKAAIGAVRREMLSRGARTFGEFLSMLRDERVTPISTPDRRPQAHRTGSRQFRAPIRNRRDSYEHCADRAMVRHEFAELWSRQRGRDGPTAALLTEALRLELDDESGDAKWQHKGLLFGQRRQSWDLGTLGRCVLEPTERCVPHADMYASRYLVVETVNNLRIIERGREGRPLTPQEREQIKAYLSGPLGTVKIGRRKGEPKQSVSVTDLRELMGWGRATKATPFRFNIESDPDRSINTDWFSREIVHGALGAEAWRTMAEHVRQGLNRAILRYDPDVDADSERLRRGAMDWAALSEEQASALVAAWKARPRPDARRLNMSRKATRNLLALMDRPEPWPSPGRAGESRWLTQIEARKLIAEDAEFLDATTGQAPDARTRERYATGAKGATARDRYYLRKHVLLVDGKPIIGPDGRALAEPPPAPMIANPVVRKAIHEVRRHLVEYLRTFGRKPDRVYVELAREAQMGKMDADRVLLRNRLRQRIRDDVVEAFLLASRTSTQRRAAMDRVLLAVQQGGICPLCGQPGLTPPLAARGDGVEVAHIVPRASGGHNGTGNLVLAHTKCNRDMGRRTPREFWSAGQGFDRALVWIEGIYREVARPGRGAMSGAKGDALWACYFSRREDFAKIEQFKKDIKDIQGMTQGQEAATKYATRRVLSYLADALFDGQGLPERGGERKIYATTGMWTSRLRREWGLFFDPHERRSKDLGEAEAHARQEKDRGDHRHHAIDAVVIALSFRSVQDAWEKRERRADEAGVNTADEEALEAYRRQNRLEPPQPFPDAGRLREAVRHAVFGDEGVPRPICHRAVKRRLIGALHEETLLGPVLDDQGGLTGHYTARKSVLQLTGKHLRVPRPETKAQAVDRLAALRQRERTATLREARAWARDRIEAPGYRPMLVRPPPGKSGIVRDAALSARLRQCLIEGGLDPDDFKPQQLKRLVEAGGLRQASGVPIRAFVVLRSMSDPVLIDRKRPAYDSPERERDADPAARRAYQGGNNHHIEIRLGPDGKASGRIVSAFEAAQRHLARLRALRGANLPPPAALRRLPRAARRALAPRLRAIELAHPMVDRRDDPDLGGSFLMSLCEGEMLHMRHKATGEPGYFVVAKLDKPGSIVLVPHWDARAAGLRKDPSGNQIADSKREDFTVSPSDLLRLAPPGGHSHARKVRVSPLAVVTLLERD